MAAKRRRDGRPAGHGSESDAARSAPDTQEPSATDPPADTGHGDAPTHATGDGARSAEAEAAPGAEEPPAALHVWDDFDEVVFPAAEEASVQTASTAEAVGAGRRKTARQDRWIIGVATADDDADPLVDDLDDDERAGLEQLRRDQQLAASRAAVTDPPVAEEDPPSRPDGDDVRVPVGGSVRRPAAAALGRVFARRPSQERSVAPAQVRPLHRAEVLAMLGAIALALALWVPLVSSVRLEDMTDLGLISALPIATAIPYGLLLASFGYCLWRAERKTLLLAIHTIALTVMVYAVRALYVEVPSFKVTYRHVGVSDAIDRLGGVDASIDAYMNWPGFFTYTESLAKAVGFDSIEPFANLAPLVYALLYLSPVLVILRTITNDRRVVWVGLWTFFLGNWVAQDYLSPQGLAFFVHLVVIAIVLRWFIRPRGAEGRAPSGPLVAMLAVVMVLAAYLVPTHQLTPYATTFALITVLATRRLTSRMLPILVGAIAATWLVLMATSYLSGHQSNVTGGIGGLGDTVSSNVVSRVVGSAERIFVNQTRIVVSVGLWLLALIGAWRLFRVRRFDPVHAIVPASAFLLIPLQSYGGEVVFRVFLFALPFVAGFAAVAVMPRRDGRLGRLGPLVGVAWLGVVLVSLVFTRYGNERMDSYTRNELAATEFLYSAPGVGTAERRGVLALGGSDNLPWKARAYEIYQWKTLQQLDAWKLMLPTGRINPARIVDAAQDLMRHYPNGSYLIFTRSQAAEIDLVGSAPRGSIQRIEGAVASSPLFQLVYGNEDARIYGLTARGMIKNPRLAAIPAVSP